jgi:hypothetical protein
MKAGRKKKLPSLADFGFSQEMIELIEDLREGYAGAPAHRAISEALRHFFNNKGIDAEPEVKRRYSEARDRRLAAKRAHSEQSN